jgi:hypothetical protein
VITANYDDLLEQRLDEAGRGYVKVAHVLRVEAEPDSSDARKSEYAGQILVVRSPHHPEAGRGPALHTRDKLDLRPDDCVIYKLLGSPFLNEMPFAKERGLDTVVITETDHIEFLTRLRSASTGVPSLLISRFFRTHKLLFLEYNLDIWHYRLIGHVFRMAGDISRAADGAVVLKKMSYVVRTPKSMMEEQFWRRFKPDHVAMDLMTLVRALRSARSSAR